MSNVFCWNPHTITVNILVSCFLRIYPYYIQFWSYYHPSEKTWKSIQIQTCSKSSSFGLSHGFPMAFPWVFHGFPMAFPWVFPWFSRGTGGSQASHPARRSPWGAQRGARTGAGRWLGGVSGGAWRNGWVMAMWGFFIGQKIWEKSMGKNILYN